MGFPGWTLWGMGLAGFAATIAIGLAYLLQSPRFLSRYGQGELGSNRQARVATGIGFALLVLAFGFFLAGVPLEANSSPTPTEPSAPVATSLAQEPLPTQNALAASTPEVSPGLETAESESSDRNTTGAFAGPPVSTSPPTITEVTALETPADETPESPTSTPEATVTSTPTPRPTSSPTTTATSTPTVTPSPTPTPTPIDGATALISTEGSTLWVRRTPGGQPLALVQDGDVVILWTGHAHQGGLLWREVRTVAGEIGWVQEEFLSFSPPS